MKRLWGQKHDWIVLNGQLKQSIRFSGFGQNHSKEYKSCVLLGLSLALPETSTLNNTRLGPLKELP
jgi:hypothetical protein